VKHISFCLAITFALQSVNGQAVSAHKPIIPVPPAELIKFLPATPAGWELKESRAKSFYNEWLVSQANREFSAPSPTQSRTPNATPAPPQITRFRLTDTGYSPALFGDFDEFKPGKYGNTESFYVDSLPARRISFSDGERLRILFKARFVIEVEVHNQPANAAVAWLRQMSIPHLNSVPDSGIETLPNPVTAVSIDEANPRLNSSYQVSWSTQQDLDAARKRKP
jgi:hypothetical protein